MRSLFPRLILWVHKSRLIIARQEDGLALAKDQYHGCNLEIYGPVTARMFNYILKDLPIRWETPVRTLMEVHSFDLVKSITFHKGGRILQDSEALPRDAYYRQERARSCLEVIWDSTMTSDEETKQTLRAVLELLKHPNCTPVPPKPGQGTSETKRSVKFSQCNVNVYDILIDMVCTSGLTLIAVQLILYPCQLRDCIPASYGYPLYITITFDSDQPTLASLEEAEEMLERAVSLYLDLWPGLHYKRRTTNFDTPFLTLQGPAFEDVGVQSAMILPTRGERGKRFMVDMKTSFFEHVAGYPRYMPIASSR